MHFSPLENLRGFATQRPPLVVFMVCLALFAIILLSLAYYVKAVQIRKVDISVDWNIFLENIAHLDYCILENSTLAENVSPTNRLTTAPGHSKGHMTTTGSMLDLVSPSTNIIMNYSISMLISLSPTQEYIIKTHNLTHLSGSILGADIGLTGAKAAESINITMEVPHGWNGTRCSSPTDCSQMKIYTCVNLQAPSYVFPMNESPEHCYSVNETGYFVDYYAPLKTFKHEDHSSVYSCRSRPSVRLEYHLDPRLTVWLSMRERSAINLHLMRTSFFLFVMVVVMFSYAVLHRRTYFKARSTSPSVDRVEKTHLTSAED